MEVQHVGYVIGVLKDSKAEGFKASEAFDTKRWDDRDVNMFERIQKIREEIAGHG